MQYVSPLSKLALIRTLYVRVPHTNGLVAHAFSTNAVVVLEMVRRYDVPGSLNSNWYRFAPLTEVAWILCVPFTTLPVAPQLNVAPGVGTSCDTHELVGLANVSLQAGPYGLYIPFTRLRMRTLSNLFTGKGLVTILLSLMLAHAVAPLGDPGLPGFAWLLKMVRPYDPSGSKNQNW